MWQGKESRRSNSLESKNDLCVLSPSPHFLSSQDVCVNGSLRLVTYLYAEQLIDQPTFLRWSLSYTEKSTIEVSPIIVILIGIFWDDLIARRPTGRKLT